MKKTNRKCIQVRNLYLFDNFVLDGQEEFIKNIEKIQISFFRIFKISLVFVIAIQLLTFYCERKISISDSYLIVLAIIPLLTTIFLKRIVVMLERNLQEDLIARGQILRSNLKRHRTRKHRRRMER